MSTTTIDHAGSVSAAAKPTCAELMTGRLWLVDTATGEDLRRATLADVVFARRRYDAVPVGHFPCPHPIDGRWVSFRLAESVGFHLPDFPGLLGKLIGLSKWK